MSLNPKIQSNIFQVIIRNGSVMTHIAKLKICSKRNVCDANLVMVWWC